MRTISQKLRTLANRPLVSEWSKNDFETHEVASGWLMKHELTEWGLESFWHMDDIEWGMFLYFISYALETE